MAASEQQEQWKPIEGFSDYEVSNLGRVVSLKHGSRKLRRLATDPKGYKRLCLCRDGVMHTVKIHREVAKAFLPNPSGLQEVNHINGDKADNRVQNLEWAGRSQNMKHASATKLLRTGSAAPSAKLTEADIPIIKQKHLEQGISQRQIAKEYGVSYPTINAIICGRKWKKALA